MERFKVLLGCEKSETGYHDYKDECRYDGEKWYSPEVRPAVLEHRAVCRKCGDIAVPMVLDLQRQRQWMELDRQSAALRMTPEDYKQF